MQGHGKEAKKTPLPISIHTPLFFFPLSHTHPWDPHPTLFFSLTHTRGTHTPITFLLSHTYTCGTHIPHFFSHSRNSPLFTLFSHNTIDSLSPLTHSTLTIYAPYFPAPTSIHDTLTSPNLLTTLTYNPSLAPLNSRARSLHTKSSHYTSLPHALTALTHTSQHSFSHHIHH